MVCKLQQQKKYKQIQWQLFFMALFVLLFFLFSLLSPLLVGLIGFIKRILNFGVKVKKLIMLKRLLDLRFSSFCFFFLFCFSLFVQQYFKNLSRKKRCIWQWAISVSLAVLTSLITILYFTHPGVVLIYTDFNFPSSIPFVITSTISLFLWIDLWAYFSHRILHIPFLYLWCHKVHHAYRQPTAFSGLGLHPVDMIFVQGGVFLGMHLSFSSSFFLSLHSFFNFSLSHFTSF